MKTASVLCTVVLSLCLAQTALAQRALTNTEAQTILNDLTSQSRATWISVGTITATHYREGAPAPGLTQAQVASDYQEKVNAMPSFSGLQEDPQKLALDALPFNTRWKLENRYNMTTTEVVKYDGQRFHWDITLTSRWDSVPLDPGLRGNYMVEHFEEHKEWNKHRIFAWDGQKYTTYSASGGYATVDTTGKLGTPAVNGALTAGLIPWGSGKMSTANLSAASVSAVEVSLGGAKVVQMEITHPDGSLSELDLDPAKANAVTFAKHTSTSGFEVTYTLGNYKQTPAGQWVPWTIVIERKNLPTGCEAPTLERWNITKVDAAKPSLSSFNVPLALDATVEYAAPGLASTNLYVNSYETDTDDLLARRLDFALAEGSRRQNCATAALQYAASQLRKPASNSAVAGLVGSNGATSLYDLKRSAQSLGLYSRVVKTDLNGLRNLGTAKAILHLPGTNHFVVLDRVDNQYVWVVDLSNRNFYYRQSVHFFPMAWSDGTALLLSDRPILGQFSEIPDTLAENLAGGAWACVTLYQEEDWVGCVYDFGLCWGDYIHYFERWVCSVVPSGYCNGTSTFPRYESSPCTLDPYVYCVITGEWFYDQMRACQ